jgi:hypothetical protein
MSMDIKALVREQAEAWSGVMPPNAVSEDLAAGFSGLIAGLTALRGQIAFEDEPSSFEAALQATKEPSP